MLTKLVNSGEVTKAARAISSPASTKTTAREST
jgi:hypothetical protein